MDETRNQFPVQTRQPIHDGAQVNRAVYMAAYEVYCHVHGEQEELVTGSCRGGFSVGELIAFLYARAFQKSEWRQRASDAFEGMKQL